MTGNSVSGFGPAAEFESFLAKDEEKFPVLTDSKGWQVDDNDFLLSLKTSWLICYFVWPFASSIFFGAFRAFKFLMVTGYDQIDEKPNPKSG